jgi:hypothetical protein
MNYLNEKSQNGRVVGLLEKKADQENNAEKKLTAWSRYE